MKGTEQVVFIYLVLIYTYVTILIQESGQQFKNEWSIIKGKE